MANVTSLDSRIPSPVLNSVSPEYDAEALTIRPKYSCKSTVVRDTVVRFPALPRYFCFLQNVQTCSGAHTTSCAMGTAAPFYGVKRPGRKFDHSPPSKWQDG
jgi:hypothetical protein